MNIRLRRLEYDDAPALVEIVNDEDVQRYLLLSMLPYTLSDAQNFIEYAKSMSLKGGEQVFAIVCDGLMVGVISYIVGTEHKSCTASIGYYVGKRYYNGSRCGRAGNCPESYPQKFGLINNSTKYCG